MNRPRPDRSGRSSAAALGWGLLGGVGVLCLALTVLAPLAQVRATFVTSGSMEPAVGVGAMVLTHRVDARSVAPGDVVGVRSPGGGGVMHRVVRHSAQGLVLRGDANHAVDPVPYAVSTVERPILVVPVAGHLLSAASAVPTWLWGAAWLVLLVHAWAPRRTGSHQVRAA